MSDREHGILLALARLRFMSTRQIHRLYGYAGNHGISVTRRKLNDMERFGWVKSWQPSKYEQKIYYISKRGALEMEYRHGVEGIKSFRKSEKSIHFTLIAEVFVQLQTAEAGILRAFEVEPKFGGLIPDAYIEFALDSRPVKLFLEVDRSTESAGYLRDIKMEKYRHYYMTPERPDALPALMILVDTEYRKSLFRRISEQYRLPAASFTIDEWIISPLSCVKQTAASLRNAPPS
ncbi:replication-relaxation family protein [Paenibacillus sp.]|uniref:replication-relaxation family protein n=1 Tax=Paenibacillus sp. TaxID=58172 RepID=UPI002D3971A9|nr:replication-relaxation family protein [Paenibacillus sp.]HZG58289.1 replication-relaxation family protein [Paenibacillus sp.]